MSAPGVYAALDDFRRMEIWRGGKRKALGGKRQDKGFAAQFELLAAIMHGEAEPPAPDTFYLSTLTTLAATRSLQTGRHEAVTSGESAGPGVAAATRSGNAGT